LLEALQGKASRRKLRLFACACFEHARRPLTGSDRLAWETGLRHADGLANPEELAAFANRPYSPDRPALNQALQAVVTPENALELWRAQDIESRDWPTEYANKLLACWHIDEMMHEADLVRCIFGNPFRHVTPLDPRWLRFDGVDRTVAETLYADHAFDRLSLLADALEDGGCTDAELLGHLRSPGPHVRGCGAVDLVLGKN
jgi:hypothetical protein